MVRKAKDKCLEDDRSASLGGADDLLLAELLSGDSADAFREIFNRYHSILYIMSVKMLKDEDEASDAVQYVFVKLWESRKNIVVKTNLKNYLYTMAKHYILNFIQSRTTKLKVYYNKSLMMDRLSESVADIVEAKDRNASIEKAISELPEKKKKVIMLKREGFSNPQVAQKMNISVNTVKVHYQEALKMLKKTLKDLLSITFFI